jgi:hypothetical protein
MSFYCVKKMARPPVCVTKLNIHTASKIREKQIPEKSLCLTGPISGKTMKRGFFPFSTGFFSQYTV